MCIWGCIWCAALCVPAAYPEDADWRIPVPGTSFSARTRTISTSSSHLQMSAYMRIRVCSARADVICSARGAAGRPLRAPAANNVPRKDNRERCDDDRKLEIAGKPLDGTG